MTANRSISPESKAIDVLYYYYLTSQLISRPCCKIQLILGSVKLSRNALFAKSRFSFSASAEMRLRASLSTSVPLETHIYEYISLCQASACLPERLWDYWMIHTSRLGILKSHNSVLLSSVMGNFPTIFFMYSPVLYLEGNILNRVFFFHGLS
jgi:hypothetical protein